MVKNCRRAFTVTQTLSSQKTTLLNNHSEGGSLFEIEVEALLVGRSSHQNPWQGDQIVSGGSQLHGSLILRKCGSSIRLWGDTERSMRATLCS